MPVSDKIRDATIANLAVDEIKRLAITGGMTTLRMAGNRKILEGRTTIEEVLSNTVSDDLVVSEPIREVRRRVEG
jgi:type IV pilus assembly protein PilB